MKERVISLLLSLALALLAVSAAVAAPILCRPFYYAHIGALHLPERTGWSEETIRTAFDDVMDYLLKGEEFGTGELKWSESGRSHFADVKGLFWLDLWILLGSAAAVAVLALVCRKVKPHWFFHRGPSFRAGVGLLVLFGVVGALAASDFQRAFTVFHALFFPGKTNWLFDPAADQIILILPEEFFRNCAVLIVALIGVFVAAYLIVGRKKTHRRR